MGNLAMSGIPVEDKVRLGLDYENYPPWVVMWIALYMDLLCKPLQCRYSWRKYLPFGLGEGDGWLSEKYESDGLPSAVFASTPELSFDTFRANQGYNVTEGSGAFAGVDGWVDVKDWIQSMKEYAFRTPSTALCNLITPTGLGTVAVLVVFIKMIKAVIMPRFRNFGRKLAQQAHGDEWLEEHEERIVKFGEYVFRLCYHSLISLVGFYCFWDAPWLDESRGGTINLFIGFPDNPVEPLMAWYYLIQAAYNVDAMVSLLQLSFSVKLFPKNSKLPLTIGWSDTVRGDFNEMLAHHIVTNALVFLSSYFRQTRIGSMVFWMHDISDVPVDMAKLANFVKWKTATVVSFVILCIAWAYTRLYVLPFVIWSAIYFRGHFTIPEAYEGMQIYYYTFAPLFLILLGILILLHAVWFSMFIKMGIVLVTKGETHDLSEHKDGEKQHPPAVTNGVANGKKAKKKAS